VRVEIVQAECRHAGFYDDGPGLSTAGRAALPRHRLPGRMVAALAILAVPGGAESCRRRHVLALVRLSAVSKVFRSLQGRDYVAVRDFDLEIEAGEFF